VGTIEQIPDIVRELAVNRVVVSLDEARGRLPMEELLNMRLKGVMFNHNDLLKAEKSWESMGAAGNVGGKAVKKAKESLVGVVDFDEKSVHLAEQDDNGLYMGRLTAPDTLDLVYMEAGHATAYSVPLTRAK
jgi:hypothetical protein